MVAFSCRDECKLQENRWGKQVQRVLGISPTVLVSSQGYWFLGEGKPKVTFLADTMEHLQCARLKEWALVSSFYSLNTLGEGD